jgi:hypothetical protein
MKAYKDRCLTCVYWIGDRKQVWEMIRANPACMDLSNGYASDGGCQNMYEFIDIEIHGDAYEVISFNANFGCIYHEKEGS